MGCPKNIKTWWIFKWEAPHVWETYWVGVWAFGKYKTKHECLNCGTTKEDFGIEGHEIVRDGYDLDKARYTSRGWGKNGYDPREGETK